MVCSKNWCRIRFRHMPCFALRSSSACFTHILQLWCMSQLQSRHLLSVLLQRGSGGLACFVNALLLRFFPDETWSSFWINFDCKKLPNRDSQNAVGSSNFTFSLGDFQGGGLCFEEAAVPVSAGGGEPYKHPAQGQLEIRWLGRAAGICERRPVKD